jgi:hypothetical protein
MALACATSGWRATFFTRGSTGSSALHPMDAKQATATLASNTRINMRRLREVMERKPYRRLAFGSREIF